MPRRIAIDKHINLLEINDISKENAPFKNIKNKPPNFLYLGRIK